MSDVTATGFPKSLSGDGVAHSRRTVLRNWGSKWGSTQTESKVERLFALNSGECLHYVSV
eukprot:2262192-Pyramimonas_sp.AAC.3